MKRQVRVFFIFLCVTLFSHSVFGIVIDTLDYFGPQPVGVSDIASALGFQVDGKASGLFAGESLMATLGPTGGGKTTLLGSRGFASGDKVRITNVGGGKLKIDRQSGSPLTIQVGVMDFMLTDSVEEMTAALGIQIVGKPTGLFARQHVSAIVGPSGSGKSTLISTQGFAAGQKVKITNAGSGKLAIERLDGASLSIQVTTLDFFRPQGVQVLTSALGVQIEGKVTGMFAKQSQNARVGIGSKLLFDKGYLKGNRVQITNLGEGKLAIERMSGSPLTIHLQMDDYYRPQVVEEIASALGLEVGGKGAGLFAKQSLNARVGNGSKMLFDMGYLKNNRVKVTNAGSGRLTLERLGGAPLSIHLQMDEYWRPQAVKEVASALGLQTVGKTAGLFKGQSFGATLSGGGSKMLFDKGYLKGNRVKVTNSGGGKFTIERLSGGAPLTVHIQMDEFF